MSVKKFKVGDKVRVREGLVVDEQYGEHVFVGGMESLAGRTLTIDRVIHDYGYRLKEVIYSWTDEMLDPVENLEKGDLIDCNGKGTVKVLAALDDCYLLSSTFNHERAVSWYTAHELEDKGWKPIQPEEAAPETIEIGGKKYNKQEFEEAVKDLEPKEGEEYKWLSITGTIVRHARAVTDTIYNYNASIGNCYPLDTPDELIIKEQKLIPQAMHRLKVAAKKAWFEYDGSEGPDWSGIAQSKYFIEYRHNLSCFDIDIESSYQVLGQIYFPTEKSAQAYIDNNQDDLKLLFGVE